MVSASKVLGCSPKVVGFHLDKQVNGEVLNQALLLSIKFSNKWFEGS